MKNKVFAIGISVAVMAETIMPCAPIYAATNSNGYNNEVSNFFAVEDDKFTSHNEIEHSELEQIDEQFKNMTVKELNQYIDSIATEFSEGNRTNREYVPTSNVQQAWLAAATILEKKAIHVELY